MPNDENLTVKQQREKRRAEKVAALKAKQKREKRGRLIGIIAAAGAGVAVLGVVIAIVISSANVQPPRDRDTIEIAGLEEFDDLEATHVQTAVDYELLPPAGGPHNPSWLNCGIYEQPVPNEYAVHSLEHGAVWVTYDAEQITGDDLETLRDAMPNTHSILSPFEGLDSPLVISAWGAQLALDGVDDERMIDFIDKFWLSPNAPEPNALCSQALDGPGKIS